MPGSSKRAGASDGATVTPRCRLCGEAESVNTSIIRGSDVCFDCLASLIDNEEERRGVAAEAKAFTDYHSGRPTTEDREREQLRQAGRGHLT